MAASSRKGHLSPKARYALELITVDPRGPLLLTYGFTRKMLAGLVEAGLATAQRQTVTVRGKPVEVIRFMITETGRQTLEADQAAELENARPLAPRPEKAVH